MFNTALAFIGLVIVLAGAYAVRRFLNRRLLLSSLRLRLLLIKLPQTALSKDKPADFKTEINLSEQLFQALSDLAAHAVFEVAVHHTGEDIYFYIAVPEESIDYAMREIHGLWPEAMIEPSGDYNIFNPEGEACAAYLKPYESPMIPFRTYAETETDTFASIVSNLSKLETVGEGASVQVIFRRALKEEQKKIHGAIEKLKRGTPLKEVVGVAAVEELWNAFGKTLSGPSKSLSTDEQKKIIDDAAIKLLEAKIAKPLFYANIRLIASAGTKDRAMSLLDNLTKSFVQFTAPRKNKWKVVIPRNQRSLLFQFSFREFISDQSVLLNSEELASLYHLPSSTTNVPKKKWLKTKGAPPPMNLPATGLIIGDSLYRGERKEVRIGDEDRRRHLYITGQTGTGKSNFITGMAAQDIKNGKGVCVIDPHGDLVEDILALVPPERADDVIVFDPGDIERPIALNMLEYDPSKPEEKTFIVNEMQAIFNRLFPPESMGPMFEQYMRNALLLLMEDRANPGTLMEVPRVFTDSAWRKAKLERITNPAVVDFWEKEAAKSTGEHSLANMAPYITSKFNNFIANDYVRPIIAQTQSAFRFRNVMDEGKILLVNLSKGRIGDINAGLLGMVIVGKLLMAALSRVDVAQEQRKDFYLYVDEFQNFTTDSIAVILSEARKYRLDLTLAHQFIGQLTDKIRDAVFGNVGSMAVFRVGAQDAEVFIKQFDPIFSQSDLINIDNFNAYAKILINNETSKGFNIAVRPSPKGSRDIGEKLKELSRTKYGQPRAEIEADITRRLREI